MLELESPIWDLIYDLLVVLVGTAIAVIGYLIKNRLERIESDRSELEQKLGSKLDKFSTEVRGEMAEVERTALGIKSELHEKMSELPEKYVPRYELQEIVRNMRDTAQHNADGVSRMDKKLDRLLMLQMEQMNKK